MDDMDDIYHRLKSRLGSVESMEMGHKMKHRLGEKLSFKDWYIYIGIPILVLLALVLARPCFVSETVTDRAGKEKKNVKWAQAITYSLVIGAVIDVAIYGLIFRKSK